MIKVRRLNDKKKIKDVLTLIGNVFFNGKTSKILIPKRNLKTRNIVVVQNNDKIIGCCIIIDRNIFSEEEVIKTSFLSFICIDDKFRGRGLSIQLMNFAIEECKKRDSKISFVIARKLVDNYYNKFGFFGVSQYSKIKLKLVPKVILKSYNFYDFDESDIPKINKVYNYSYQKILGSFRRYSDYWKFIKNKCKSLKLNFKTIYRDKKFIGYIIYNNESIYEISLINKENYLEILEYLLNLKKIKSLISIECSLDHPVNFWLHECDYSLEIRQCLFGGHMARINDPKFFVSRIKNFKEDFKFDYSGNTDKTNFKNNQMNFELTSLMLNSNFLSNSRFYHNKNSKSFNIPIMDQI
tara:strand:- start:1174 stop:2232 length:1059 start_codon:yes stop_codon:yes gene_type:complete